MNRITTDWFAERLSEVRSKQNPTEADVSGSLIRPVLENVLNFRVSEIDAEPVNPAKGKKDRPDFVCRRHSSGTASVIVEVKNLDVDFMKRSGGSWSTSPLGQLQNYLNRYKSSVVGTWGILTNGSEWLITQRENEHVSPFYDIPKISRAETLSEIQEILAEVQTEKIPKKEIIEFETTDWLDVISNCHTPDEFIRNVVSQDILRNSIEKFQCGDVAFTKVSEFNSECDTQHSVLKQEVHLIALCLNYPDGKLAPSDITESLLAYDALTHGRTIGVAWTDTAIEGVRMCRGFFFEDKNLLATALINPLLPGPRAERQFAALAKDGKKAVPKETLEALSSAPMHKDFHEKIGKWFSQTSQTSENLQHLVRVMFCWILQQRRILPDNTLWDQGRKPSGDYEVHHHIEYLFGKILALPIDERENLDNGDPWLESLIQDIPFLNGSLFSGSNEEKKPVEIENDAYLSHDGLLTIFAQYDWTLCSRTGYESETALDPNMLGEMFEQLMLQVEGVRFEGKNLKMPGGTYYTPQDVVEEMVADSIAGWIEPKIPDISLNEIRDLVCSMPKSMGWVGWNSKVQGKIRKHLGSIRVLDPCCGSGAFTMGMLHALWRALSRLSENRMELTFQDMEKIIAQQIYAADIHPLAVLITRLRLFIFLVDVISHYERDKGTVKPLPNLETRVIAINTLCVDLSRQHKAHSQKWKEGIENLRCARELWTKAHYPAEKQVARLYEKEAREALRNIGEDSYTTANLGWLDMDFLSPSAPPVEYDIREMFPEPDGGWDIVIGNPPYQRPDQLDQKRGHELGYIGYSANLYLMFIEVAMKVVASDGCITLVVPHSLIFRRESAFRNIRNMIEASSRRIDIRTYDNRLQPLFPKLPWLKGVKKSNENRQRATILIVCKGVAKEKARIYSQGLIRLSAKNRSKILKQTSCRGQVQPQHTQQWTQAPSPELSELLQVMSLGYVPPDESKYRAMKEVTFPRTLMYFISCLPNGLIENYRRRAHKLADNSLYWPWVGLYNSHLFHAYWLMLGDAFDLTEQEYGSVREPEGWQDESVRLETENLAKQLIESRVLKACESNHTGKGGVQFPNVNFHMEDTPGPAIIEKLDQILIYAYGLKEEPLLSQMRTIRTGSAHMLNL